MFPVALVLFLAISCSAQDALGGKGLRFREYDPVPGVVHTAINDHGDVAASYPFGAAILVAADGTVTNLGEGLVTAMNNRRQIVLLRDQHVFLRHPDGTMEPRTYPGSDSVVGYGLNDSGIVVGEASGVAVVWDEAGTANALRMPLNRYLPLGVSARSINDSGEIAGAYFLGSGPYEVYRRSADGFFRDVGVAVRNPGKIVLSNSGVLLYSHANALGTINTEIRSSSGAVIYAASDSAVRPRGLIPVFSGMSPNGRLLIGGYAPSGPRFQAEVCAVEVTPSEVTVPLEGGTVTVAVKADVDCEWYSEASGRQKGDGEVTVAIAAAQAAKTSHFWIAGQDVVVRQGGGACEYRLPGSHYSIGVEGGTIRVPVTTAPDCAWRVSGNVLVSPAAGIGPGELRVIIRPTESAVAIQGYDIRVGDAQLRIFQDPVPCTRQITFPSDLGAGSGAALLTLKAPPGCELSPYTQVDWLRLAGLIRESPSTSHHLFSYDANSTGQSRMTEVQALNAVIPAIRQHAAAAGDALLVEPITGTGPRQQFRFTFAEPAGQPEISIGKACTIRHRIGFFPFTIDGSCQLNDASVTTVAGRFRTMNLDITFTERGPLSIVSGTRALGTFVATDRTPESPKFTAPKPHSGAIGFSIDSDHGYGGTFRMVMESANQMPIRTAAVTFWGGPDITSCTVELNVSTRQLGLSTLSGNSRTPAAGAIALGGSETLESDACVVKGASGAFTALNPEGSRAVWDVSVFFRSTWSGGRGVWVDVVGADGVNLRQPGSIGYTIDSQVPRPSLAIYSDLVRVGISSSAAIASARVAAGECLFEYDPAGGLRASAGQPCRLDLARSAAVASGGNLTLVLAYSGDPSGASGLRPLKVEATPAGGVASGWFLLGQVPAR